MESSSQPRRDAAALEAAAHAEIERGDFRAAAKLFAAASKHLQPGATSRAALVESQAQCHLEAEDYAQAAKAGSAAVVLDPLWAPAWLTFGRASLNDGQFGAAAGALRRAMELDRELVAEVGDDLERAEQLEREEDERAMTLHSGATLRFRQWRGGGGGDGGSGELTVAGGQCGTCDPAGLGTGTMVWECSVVLAALLDHASSGPLPASSPLRRVGRVAGGGDDSSGALSLRGLRVLELGSGVGVGGLAAAALGASALLTDLPSLVPLISQNLQLNSEVVGAAGGAVTAESLDWERLGPTLPAAVAECDLILGADLCYQPEGAQLTPLVALLRRLMLDEPGGGAPPPRRAPVLLLAHKARHATLDAALRRELGDAGIVLSEVPHEQHHPDFRSPSISVLIGVARPGAGPPHAAPAVEQDGPSSAPAAQRTPWRL